MKKNIVLIEDDEALRLGLELVLTDENYSVMALSDGEHLESSILNFIPDLFLIDYRLPGPDGLTISRLIRRSEDTRDVPIIIISASGDNLPELARRAGANEFLRKPFDLGELTRVIGRHLSAPKRVSGD